MEEGTTTTPFDMTVLNGLDCFHLAQEALLRVPSLQGNVEDILEALQQKIAAHHHYVREYGEDLPEIQNGKWPSRQGKARFKNNERPWFSCPGVRRPFADKLAHRSDRPERIAGNVRADASHTLRHMLCRHPRKYGKAA
jgi:hypothetical protein